PLSVYSGVVERVEPEAAAVATLQQGVVGIRHLHVIQLHGAAARTIASLVVSVLADFHAALLERHLVELASLEPEAAAPAAHFVADVAVGRDQLRVGHFDSAVQAVHGYASFEGRYYTVGRMFDAECSQQFRRRVVSDWN